MSQQSKKIALFASGNGSNVQNIATYFQNKSLLKPALVLTNKSDAFVIERAKALDIPCIVFSSKELKETSRILDLLKNYQIDFIVLAGFLLQIPMNLIENYPNKIINIHPALLPKYGGKGMYGDYVHQAVKEAQEKETGITIHFVNEHYDDGQIIFQKKISINEKDTSDSIAEKVHALEYEYFPQIIEDVIRKQ